MTALVVPADCAAEEVVVGCAVSTVHGAALAAERLAADDFYWPAYRGIFAAAVALTAVRDEADRIPRCAEQAEVPETVVASLVQRRSVMFDMTGSYARRVLDASRRRRLMHVCELAYRGIAEGGSVEQALKVLEAAS